jgi:hypothetical protein
MLLEKVQGLFPDLFGRPGIIAFRIGIGIKSVLSLR